MDMTEKEIIEAYRKIEAKKKETERVENARESKNNATFELIRLIKATEPYLNQEPMIIEDTLSDAPVRNGYGEEPHSGEVESYLEGLPEGCTIKVTIEVTGPIEQEGLTYTCDVCKQSFDVKTGVVKNRKGGWSGQHVYLCDEHKNQ